MNPEDIKSGLIAACKTVAQARGLSPVLPGVEYEALPVPCIVFDYVPTDRPMVTLKGGVRRELGLFYASIAVQISVDGDDTALGHAAVIAGALESAALGLPSIAITGGKIDLLKPVDTRRGYPDGKTWRVPVVATYVANAT